MTSPSGTGAAIDMGKSCIVTVPQYFPKAGTTNAEAEDKCNTLCLRLPNNLCTHVSFLALAGVSDYICQVFVCTGTPSVTNTPGGTGNEKVCPTAQTTTTPEVCFFNFTRNFKFWEKKTCF